MPEQVKIEIKQFTARIELILACDMPFIYDVFEIGKGNPNDENAEQIDRESASIFSKLVIESITEEQAQHFLHVMLQAPSIAETPRTIAAWAELRRKRFVSLVQSDIAPDLLRTLFSEVFDKKD